MKVINKAYILVGILIAAAAVNLFLLYQAQQESTDESYTIIRASDLRVKVETITSLASSIASGNEDDRTELKRQSIEFEDVLNVLKTGGSIRGQTVITVPDSIIEEYDEVKESWEPYKETSQQIQVTSVFDQDSVKSLNYVLEKNAEIGTLTNGLINDFANLDRDFNRHKEIAEELHEISKEISQKSILISLGEGEEIRTELQKDRISFDLGIRKLLQVPIDDLELKLIDGKYETLTPLPRENSGTLRQLDPLWESIRLRIMNLEQNSLISKEFGTALNTLADQRLTLLNSLNEFLDSWNEQLQDKTGQRQNIVQGLLGADFIVFFLVLFVIRKSLKPLGIIASGLSRVKEGVYGEKLSYKSKDEMGELIDSFNVMSKTIKEKEEEAKRMDLSKDEFLAMITHELKTPLVPIQGYADILLGEHLGDLTDRQKDRLKIIKSSAASLLQLISDLLDAQKLDLGQLRIKEEKKNISDTIELAIETLHLEINEKKIDTEFSKIDIIVPHDPSRIKQVITNLIKNSIDAVEAESGKIQVTLEDLDSEVKISVKDNGIGIPEDKQKDLFKKFYQIDASLTRERGGSGLGLSICKGIVENHGGEIHASSIPNVGSTFSFTLPKGEPNTQYSKK